MIRLIVLITFFVSCNQTKYVPIENEIKVWNLSSNEKGFPNIPNHIMYSDSIFGDTIKLYPILVSDAYIRARGENNTLVKVEGELNVFDVSVKPSDFIAFTALNQDSAKMPLDEYIFIVVVLERNTYTIQKTENGRYSLQ